MSFLIYLIPNHFTRRLRELFPNLKENFHFLITDISGKFSRCEITCPGDIMILCYAGTILVANREDIDSIRLLKNHSSKKKENSSVNPTFMQVSDDQINFKNVLETFPIVQTLTKINPQNISTSFSTVNHDNYRNVSNTFTTAQSSTNHINFQNISDSRFSFCFATAIPEFSKSRLTQTPRTKISEFSDTSSTLTLQNSLAY